MEGHLPEYECTRKAIANAEEVPAMNFNGACYALELIKAAVLQSIQKACNVDLLFSKHLTRSTKVCRRTTSCLSVPMDKDLFVDVEDFAKACRKEVPPGVRINVKNLSGPAMVQDKYGKSRCEMLCTKMALCPIYIGLQEMRTTSNFIL